MSDATVETFPRTTEEFLAWPGDDRVKHYELVDGEVRAMSPASVVHAVIQLTFGSMIRQHLRDMGSPCKVMTEPAVRPRLRAQSNVRVPDLGVTCSPIRAGQIVMEDPILLVEILSPSNKAKTWTNVWAYTTIPSVREIVVIHSDRLEVQLLRVSAERIWPDNPETLLQGDTFRLNSIDFTCVVDDVYSDTPLV